MIVHHHQLRHCFFWKCRQSLRPCEKGVVQFCVLLSSSSTSSSTSEVFCTYLPLSTCLDQLCFSYSKKFLTLFFGIDLFRIPQLETTIGRTQSLANEHWTTSLTLGDGTIWSTQPARKNFLERERESVLFPQGNSFLGSTSLCLCISGEKNIINFPKFNNFFSKNQTFFSFNSLFFLEKIAEIFVEFLLLIFELFSKMQL